MAYSHWCCVPTFRQEAVVISGRKLARQIREEARADVEKWVLAGNRRPHLSVVLVGDNPASHSYVLNKTRAAADVGKGHTHIHTHALVHTCSSVKSLKNKGLLVSLSCSHTSNLPQESPLRRFSSTRTSVRRSYWTWSTNSTQTTV